MLTLEQILEKLEDRNLTKVAEKTGIHSNVLYRLTKDKSQPKYETIKKLSDYLEK